MRCRLEQSGRGVTKDVGCGVGVCRVASPLRPPGPLLRRCLDHHWCPSRASTDISVSLITTEALGYATSLMRVLAFWPLGWHTLPYSHLNERLRLDDPLAPSCPVPPFPRLMLILRRLSLTEDACWSTAVSVGRLEEGCNGEGATPADCCCLVLEPPLLSPLSKYGWRRAISQDGRRLGSNCKRHSKRSVALEGTKHEHSQLWLL